MKRAALSVVLSLLAAGILGAQGSKPLPAPAQSGQPDPFGRLLYPPELVMQHQGEIGLTDAQRSSIQKDAITAQYKFVDMQWKMSGEMEKLTNLLSATPIDEAQVMEQLDRILSAERDVKKAQIGLLIRIKNTLTRDQQEKLDRFRALVAPKPIKEPAESLPPGDR
jgi:Spy/CpxP family protein refolding chaperone